MVQRVTAIEQQKHNRDRFSVFLDGEFAFGASQFVLLSHGLEVGTELDVAEVAALREADGEETAYGAALNLLSFRPRSRREIEDALRRKGIAPQSIAAALDRLQRNGLLNDDEFARYWVDNRQTHRPRGGRAIRQELRRKGLERDIIDEAVDAMGDEEPLALQAAEEKLRSYARLDDQEFARKMIAFLQRRGFGYAVAAKTARTLVERRGGDLEIYPESDPD